MNFDFKNDNFCYYVKFDNPSKSCTLKRFIECGGTSEEYELEPNVSELTVGESYLEKVDEKSVSFKSEYWNQRRFYVMNRCLDLLKEKCPCFISRIIFYQNGEEVSPELCDVPNHSIIRMHIEEYKHYKGFGTLVVTFPGG